MIDRIKALFAGSGQSPQHVAGKHGHSDLQVAAAALLVEGAQMDASFGEAERARILDLVRARFGLNDAESESLLDVARREAAGSTQLYEFARIVKDSFDHEERVELIEMLWEVVYADGALHDLEASLMRRIAGLIYVPDRDSGAARKRALKKLGLKD